MTSALSAINPYASKPSVDPLDKMEQGRMKGEIEVSVGGSAPIVDIIRNIAAIPMKLLLWNRNMRSGNVSPEVIEDARQYLHANGLHDVYLSVNEYRPGKIWDRIFSNPNTSTLSKCTVGVANGLRYTFMPDRLMGGDQYDPTSNTVQLFSNDSSVALHECGHAKDFNSRENPILYGLSKNLPYVGAPTLLYQEYTATDNAIKYAKEEGMTEKVKNAYKVLVPAFSTYVAATVLPEVPSVASCFKDSTFSEATQCVEEGIPAKAATIFFATIGIVIAGHIIGHALAKDEPEAEKSTGKAEKPVVEKPPITIPQDKIPSLPTAAPAA